MTNDSLETQVAECVKGVDDNFENQLNLISEPREPFRLCRRGYSKKL
jgi:hypothetical protein